VADGIVRCFKDLDGSGRGSVNSDRTGKGVTGGVIGHFNSGNRRNSIERTRWNSAGNSARA